MPRISFRRRWIAAALATGTATLALAGAASGSGTSSIEHFTFMTTSVAADHFTVIATGAFTDGGTAAPLSGHDTITFPDGSVTLVGVGKSKPVMTSDTKTCYETLTQAGKYKIGAATGKYKGLTGSGTFMLRIREIGPIVNGKCDTSTSKRVASEGMLVGRGPVTLP